MVCHSCRTQNRDDAAFCTECGSKLSKAQKGNSSCPKCGYTNPPDASYCSDCGAFLKNSQNQKIRNKPSPNTGKRKPVQQSGSSLKLALGLAAVVIVSILLAKTFAPRPGAVTQPPLAAADVIPLMDSRVLAVAQQFRCSCGTCGGTPLEECSCPTAAREKAFIAEQLQNGKTLQQTVALVDSAFGWNKYPGIGAKDNG